MKWIYRLSSLVILCAALSLPFYADYRSGGSFLELEKIPGKIMSALSPSKSEINAEISSNSSGQTIRKQSPTLTSADQEAPVSSEGSSDGKITYYRWQDEQGQWHFSDQAPEVASEKALIDPNALSTISGMDQSVIDRTMVNGSEESQSRNSPPKFTETEPSLDNLGNVMENAQQAAQMMQERNEALSQIVGE